MPDAAKRQGEDYIISVRMHESILRDCFLAKAETTFPSNDIEVSRVITLQPDAIPVVSRDGHRSFVNPNCRLRAYTGTSKNCGLRVSYIVGIAGLVKQVSLFAKGTPNCS
jgi:hypothetical protein